MGHSQAEKAASRERILEAAAQQIGERGLDSVAVAELMQNAGLTKGAFYGHFESREAMIAEAARRAMANGQDKLDPLFAGRKPPTLEKVVDVWLDPKHVGNPGGGCGLCTLAGEARYAGSQVQQVVADQFSANVGQIARAGRREGREGRHRARHGDSHGNRRRGQHGARGRRSANGKGDSREYARFHSEESRDGVM